MNLVVTQIVPDMINRRPGRVTVTLFDNKGEKFQDIVFTGGKFPDDLLVGEELVFVQKEKRDRYNSIPSS